MAMGLFGGPPFSPLTLTHPAPPPCRMIQSRLPISLSMVSSSITQG